MFSDLISHTPSLFPTNVSLLTQWDSSLLRDPAINHSTGGGVCLSRQPPHMSFKLSQGSSILSPSAGGFGQTRGIGK